MISETELDKILRTHLVDPDAMRSTNFDACRPTRALRFGAQGQDELNAAAHLPSAQARVPRASFRSARDVRVKKPICQVELEDRQGVADTKRGGRTAQLGNRCRRSGRPCAS